MEFEPGAAVRALLNRNQFWAAFQPIVDLRAGTTLGFEAFLRFEAEPAIPDCESLFAAANAAGLVAALERAAMHTTITAVTGLPDGVRLFLNVDPHTLIVSDIRRTLYTLVEATPGLSADSIVLELTERSVIDDYATLRETIAACRSVGFRVAIDDVGAGYNSLRSVLELRPEYVKVDKSVVQGCDHDKAKRALLGALVTFAHRLDLQVVAEGIERQGELLVALESDVDYGQGFLFGRPAAAMIEPSVARFGITVRGARAQGDAAVPQLSNLAQPALLIDGDTSGEAVLAMVRDHEGGDIVVIDGDDIVGLLTRDQLFTTFASRYGLALYGRRPVRTLVDHPPLFLAGDTSVTRAAEVLGQQANDAAPGAIIVLDGGRIVGTVTVVELVRSVIQVQHDWVEVGARRAIATRADQLNLLHRLAQRVTARLDLRETLAEVVAGVLDATGADLACILLVEAEDGDFVMRHIRGNRRPETADLRIPHLSPIPDWLSGPTHHVSIASQTAANLGGPESVLMAAVRAEAIDGLLCAPLRLDDQVIGVLVAGSRRRAIFRQDQIEVLRLLADHAAIAIHNARLFADARAQASTDALTGLANRRALMNSLDRAVRAAVIDGTPLAVLLIDLDHLKRVNDSLGHAAGDAELVAVAEVLRRTIRIGDCAARYGGDEFALVLSGATACDALRIGERVRAGVEAGGVHQTSGCSVSVGVACWPDDGTNAEALLTAADYALYLAKGSGRNRVLRRAAHAAPAAAVAG